MRVSIVVDRNQIAGRVVFMEDTTMTTTTCQHPADKASTETLLTACPDCGAECSGTSIGDDGLCYDERCPLHQMEGAITVRAYAITTDAVSTTITAGNADEAVRRFAASEKIAGVETLGDLETWLRDAGGFGRVTEDGVDIMRVRG